MHSNWIDIKIEHPHFNKNRYVLVYMPKAYQKIDVLTVYNSSNGVSRFERGWNLDEGVNEVTHWMPLPNFPTKSCNVPCSPSDCYKGGKCDKNGCYH